MFQVLSRELEGIDDRFPLRLGQLDARHPFCVRNHLWRNRSAFRRRRQRPLKNGRSDPRRPKNRECASPSEHDSTLLG